jgi:hypothetical protein
MTKPFQGTINIDIRDSVPDWEPYKQPEAKAGARSDMPFFTELVALELPAGRARGSPLAQTPRTR